MSKKENLLTIKKDIEEEYKTRALPLATIVGIQECFNNLIENKCFVTFRGDIANWFIKYDFIDVTPEGIDFVIRYRGKLL